MRTQTVIQQSLLAASALAGAALLLFPSRAHSYAYLGRTLNLTQRDVRVFNNFSDPEANDWLAPDPDFPGATGAVLSIWKACVEWGSELHKSGQGDPLQPNGLGSGAANFDYSWQGTTNAVGGPDDNVVSEISGASLGIYAYTETPISDGWRIRFYAGAAIWDDDPYAPNPAHKDLQGVATHELGHALGLAHSSDPLATMYASIQGTGAPERSIEDDDRNGLAFLYGPKSATKPHVGSYTIAGGQLVVLGAGFSAFGDEVWFTDAGATADGTPFKVTGLAAINNGTELDLALPAQAGMGDLLVKNAGVGGSALSNAFPFRPDMSSCPEPVHYGVPKPNSLGGLPFLYLLGRPNLLTNDLVIGTGGGVPGAGSVLFSGSAAANLPFAGGTLYVAAPYRRFPARTMDFTGSTEIAVPVVPQMIGTRRYYQLWFQDPGDAFGVGLSDALAIDFCP